MKPKTEFIKLFDYKGYRYFFRKKTEQRINYYRGKKTQGQRINNYELLPQHRFIQVLQRKLKNI